MAILILLVVFVGVMIAAYAVNGWALVHLWGWFMVPLGLPNISLPWAVGISIVIGFLTNHNEPKKVDDTDAGKALLYVFLRPILALAVGWVVQGYMR